MWFSTLEAFSVMLLLLGGFFDITGIVLEMKERWKKGTQVGKEKQEKGRAGIYPFGV